MVSNIPHSLLDTKPLDKAAEAFRAAPNFETAMELLTRAIEFRDVDWITAEQFLMYLEPAARYLNASWKRAAPHVKFIERDLAKRNKH